MPVRRPTLASPVAVTATAVAGASALVALVSVRSPQAAMAVTLVLAVLGLYVHSPRAAVVATWGLWLLIPGVRRAFGLLGPLPGSDPLSLVPFVATGAIAVLEARRWSPDRRTRRMVQAAALGLAMGVPLGLSSPQALLFAALAYGSALLATFIGYGEGRRGELTLRSALLLAAPLLAVYGVVQYFVLPRWDALWLSTVDLASIGSPEQGHVRIFSTLNSPGPLASVLALALLCVVAAPRFTARSAALALPLLIGLALTYVRGAWVSLLLAVLVALLLLGGRGALRVACLTAIGVSLLFGFGATPTGRAFQERVQSVSSGNSDVSANARLDRMKAIGPAAGNPLGSGLGQAGLATSLNTGEAGGTASSEVGGDVQRNTDNGILALVLQLGPLGAALVLGALLWGVSVVVRSAVRRRGGPALALVATLLSFLLVSEFFGDALYGVTGAFAWYLIGWGLGRSAGAG